MVNGVGMSVAQLAYIDRFKDADFENGAVASETNVQAEERARS